MPQPRPLHFAILGAGHIAGKMAATLAFLKREGEVVPYAVASRDAARAEALRAAHGFARAYGSYESMLADPAVDVVYVATPNSLHHAHVRAALLAGRHVVCEKPFTMTAAEAEDLFALARERGLFVLEAVWTRFQPCVARMREVVASGEIGAPRLLQATFALNIAAKERLRSPALGGGALLDLGIYALHFADLHFGLDVSRLSSHATLTPEGVDDQSAIALEYRDGRLALLSTSMTAAFGTAARIAGTKGCIDAPQLTRCQGFAVRAIPGDAERAVACPFDFNGYEYEIRAAARAVAEGRLECAECPWAATLAVTRLMERLRAEWGCAAN